MRRPSGTSAMPSATRRWAGRRGDRTARRSGCRRASAATRPTMDLQQCRLAGAVGADDRHRLGLGDVKVDAEERLEVAVADVEVARRASSAAQVPGRASSARSSPRYTDAHLVRLAMTSCGSPSISLRPESTAIMRSTTRSSACTMCSIHTIATPVARISLDGLDEFEDLGLGEPAGDLVEQQQTAAASRVPGQARDACDRAASANRRRRWPCRACPPARVRRRPPPPA